jgi:hypothetical protein
MNSSYGSLNAAMDTSHRNAYQAPGLSDGEYLYCSILNEPIRQMSAIKGILFIIGPHSD